MSKFHSNFALSALPLRSTLVESYAFPPISDGSDSFFVIVLIFVFIVFILVVIILFGLVVIVIFVVFEVVFLFLVFFEILIVATTFKDCA